MRYYSLDQAVGVVSKIEPAGATPADLFDLASRGELTFVHGYAGQVVVVKDLRDGTRQLRIPPRAFTGYFCVSREFVSPTGLGDLRNFHCRRLFEVIEAAPELVGGLVPAVSTLWPDDSFTLVKDEQFLRVLNSDRGDYETAPFQPNIATLRVPAREIDALLLGHGSKPSDVGSTNVRQRNTLLKVIAALAKDKGLLEPDATKPLEVLEDLMAKAGHERSKQTLRGILNEARTLPRET